VTPRFTFVADFGLGGVSVKKNRHSQHRSGTMHSRVLIRELGMLTVRQRAFLREKILGSNDKEAAIAAGYSPSVSENTKQKIWSKPIVSREFQRLRERYWSETKAKLARPIDSEQ
jgi:hypothetical protein